jgi:hypothetical protein
MKGKIHLEYLYNKYLFIILIIILFISIILLFNVRNGYITNEEFINKQIVIDKNKEEKLQLSCTQEENKLICKNALPQKEIIKTNYPPLNYEKGLGDKKSDGYIEFNNRFTKKPDVYTQSIIDEEFLKNENALNVDVYNVSQKGFYYKKNILESDGETGLTGLSPDDKNNFSWFAL